MSYQIFYLLILITFVDVIAQDKIPDFQYFFVDKDKYILASTDNKKRDKGEIWVCNKEGLVLRKHKIFQGYENDVYRYDDYSEIIGYYYPSSLLIYWCQGYFFSYSITNYEEKILFKETYELLRKYTPDDNYSRLAYQFDPSSGVLIIGQTPEKIEIDVVRGNSTEVKFPDEAMPIKKIDNSNYLMAELYEADDPFPRHKIYTYNINTKQKSKIYLSGGTLNGNPVGDYIFYAYRDANKPKTTIFNVKTKVAKDIPIWSLTGNGQIFSDGSLIICGSTERYLFNPSTSSKKLLGYIDGMLMNTGCYDPLKKMILQYYPEELKGYWLTKDDVKELAFDLRKDPGIPKMVPGFQSSYVTQYDTKGQPFSTIKNGSYLWPHHAQFELDALHTAWEDMNLDGYNDLIIQYKHWNDNKEAIDILFSDKSGGFTGYHRIFISPYMIFTAPGVLVALKDVTPFSEGKVNFEGWRLIFNPQTNNLELYKVTKINVDPKLYTKASDYTEECKDINNNGFYNYYAWEKPKMGDYWTIYFNGKRLAPFIRISDKDNYLDLDGDGFRDYVRLLGEDMTDKMRKILGDEKSSKIPKRYVDINLGKSGEKIIELDQDPRFSDIGDFNGDNLSDVAFTYTTNRKLFSIIYGNKNPDLIEMKTYNSNGDCEIILAVDINNDGKAELISRSGGDFRVFYFNDQKELVQQTSDPEIRFSEFQYAAFDRINNDETLDYVAISLSDTEKGYITATTYIGELTNNAYKLHGAKQKWLDFETPTQQYLKEYAEWEERKKRNSSSNRPYCSVCKGTGASYTDLECSDCRYCKGKGYTVSQGFHTSSRYEMWNGREVMVNRTYNTYSSSVCGICYGAGKFYRQGISPCSNCHGSGREPK
jgi:hypothetical protein